MKVRHNMVTGYGIWVLVAWFTLSPWSLWVPATYESLEPGAGTGYAPSRESLLFMHACETDVRGLIRELAAKNDSDLTAEALCWLFADRESAEAGTGCEVIRELSRTVPGQTLLVQAERKLDGIIRLRGSERAAQACADAARNIHAGLPYVPSRETAELLDTYRDGSWYDTYGIMDELLARNDAELTAGVLFRLLSSCKSMDSGCAGEVVQALSHQERGGDLLRFARERLARIDRAKSEEGTKWICGQVVKLIDTAMERKGWLSL